ncbi:MAG TPA: tRNA (adenosine(37)-N6)-threonylcarbamoyltransferase complex dimerization subunit type 1 TsaB [Cryomorphaceae bacterium]|nr:tRNA (adenosine(37)-N6)-threonylcarbamoyltransferase complex dimerization subunit type 1 TsaB [Cryomorphaceae bacterium]
MILSLETSTKVCSVALSDGSDVIAYREDRSNRYSHAELLNVYIDEVMTGYLYGELKAVAVSEGPGSYTGLRIGVSAAKGLAFGLNIPIIAVPTLESMTLFVSVPEDSLLIPMIDARRMEVFCAGYDSHRKSVFPTRAEILTEASFPEFDQFEKGYFFGDGAEKCKPVLEPKGLTFIPEVYGSANQMAIIAAEKYANRDFVDLAYFEPYYLKDFVAGKPKKAK